MPIPADGTNSRKREGMPQPAACPVLSARAEPTSTKARAPSGSWALFKHLDLMSVWDPAGFKAKKTFLHL